MTITDKEKKRAFLQANPIYDDAGGHTVACRECGTDEEHPHADWCRLNKLAVAGAIVDVAPRVVTTDERENGERERVRHALQRLSDSINAMRIALNQDAPIGLEGPQALMTTAGEIAAHSAAADAYRRTRG